MTIPIRSSTVVPTRSAYGAATSSLPRQAEEASRSSARSNPSESSAVVIAAVRSARAPIRLTAVRYGLPSSLRRSWSV
ncbi:hypothetical protein ACFQX6_42675 [Streptosporangium lutulentum]